MLTIATTQYQLQPLAWEDYAQKIKQLVLDAKQRKAQLLLLPEYAGIEYGDHAKTDRDLYLSLQPQLPAYISLFAELARSHDIYIQPGTILVEADSLFYNRAYFFSPDGEYSYQDKLYLTEYEKQTGMITAGMEQIIFETRYGKIAIAVCYDSEFSTVFKNVVQAGAWLVLVPSYTNSLAGLHRVQLCCRARAIENQCYVAVSFTVGEVAFGDKPYDTTTGQAGIFSPADVGLPNDGIVALGKMNQSELIVAEIDYGLIEHVRKHGAVLNFEDGLVDKKFRITTKVVT